MLHTFKNGQGSVILRAKLLDSSSTTGAGLTGLLFSSTGLIISTIADNEATATAYTAAGSTTETITTLGTFAAPTATKCRFKEVDATNHKGVYEFQFADARFAVSSAKSLLVSVLGATNLQQADFLIQLQTDDPYVAKPTNSNLTSIDSNGRIDVIKIAGTSQTARDIGASVLLSTGTGTGQLDFTSGVVKSNVTQWLGTAASTPTVAGVPNVNVKTWNDLTTVALPATPTNITSAAGISLASTGLDLVAASSTGAQALADAIWDEPVAGHQTPFSACRVLSLGGSTILETTSAGTPTTTTIQLTAGSTVDDFYKDLQIFPVSGALLGQARTILSYAGATKIATVDEAFTTAATAGDAIAIRSVHTHTVSQIQSGLATPTNITAGTITTVTNLTNAPTNGDLTAAMIASVTTAATAATPTAAAVTGAVGSVTGAVGSVTARVTANTDQLAGQTVTAAAGVTFPASVASPTNITAGVITTVENLTNAPTSGDLTATMKTSVGTAITGNATIVQIQADTDDIQTRIPAALSGGNMKVDILAIGTSTAALDGFKRGTISNVIGTVGVGSTTTSIVSSALTPSGAVADQFKGRIIIFAQDTTTAALRGQATDITASTGVATPTFTVTALTSSAVSGDTFVIV